MLQKIRYYKLCINNYKKTIIKVVSKMIKKIFILLISSILIIGCSNTGKSNNKDSVSDDNNPKYFKKDYEERYLSYKKINPDLSNEDIITRVNIGLDNPFYTNTKETPYLNKIHILSNKYLYMPKDYTPENLEKIDFSFANGTRLLVQEAKLAFENLAKQAKSEGYNIRAISAYRSYQYQSVLYNKYVDQDGIEKADTYSARAGFSEHQTGLVVDVDNINTSFTNFESTKEFNWMKENAYKFGFILRYPEGKENITGYQYESWHYRYVGEEIANIIKQQNITFDEYYARYLDN